MADFPTLDTGPVGSITEKPATDAADIRSSMENGQVITRRRFTRVPVVFQVRYGPLSDANHSTLAAFIAAQGATGSFNWTHPVTGTVHVVRFVKRPSLTRKGIFWHMTCELEEV